MHKRISMSQGILRRFPFRDISLKREEQTNQTDNGFLTINTDRQVVSLQHASCSYKNIILNEKVKRRSCHLPFNSTSV